MSELRSDTPGSRTFTEIANDIVEVREALYDCTGSAFLSGDKGQPGDRYAIYLKLCAANNALWGIVEELQAISSPPSETKAIYDPSRIDAGMAKLGMAPSSREIADRCNIKLCPNCDKEWMNDVR